MANAVTRSPRPTARLGPGVPTVRSQTPVVLVLAGFGAAACIATLWIEARYEQDALPGDVAWFGAWLSYLVVGALVARRRADLPLGGVLVGAGASIEVAGLLDALAHLGLERGWSGSGVRALAWVSNIGFLPAVLLVGVVLPLLFPTGVLRGRFDRRLLRAGGAAWAALVVGVATEPGHLPTEPVPNPVGLPVVEWLPRLLTVGGAATFAVVAAACLATLCLRWRRASRDERRGLAYLAVGVMVQLTLVAAAEAAPLVGWHGAGRLGPLVVVVMVSALPVTVGVAILRTGLLDIELVLRRTLTYVAMTVAVLAVYAATVVLVGRAVDRTEGLSLSLLLTGVAAVGLSPLRERAQRQVDRLLYGRRADPYGVLRELDAVIASARTPAAVLAGVTATIARSLKAPYVAIEVDGVRTAHGDALATVRSLPLTHHGRVVGTLLLAPRSPGEDFSAFDDRLLGDVADHVASAVAAVALAGEAQQSRERLVHALEDDRRRIRRDLHDQLGPVLSGITLQLDALRRLTAADPEAHELAGTIRDEVADAVVDVRRLVHDLRPPVLDELGLADATRQYAARLADRLAVTVDARPLPPLPAAVEVAAYRIATEALTNTLRHAAASHATVSLVVDAPWLHVRVVDDGQGIAADASPGVGLQSMRERVDELGGRMTIGAAEPGTVVDAQLPL